MSKIVNVVLNEVEGGHSRYVEIRGIKENGEYVSLHKLHYGTKKRKGFNEALKVAKLHLKLYKIRYKIN